MGFKDGISRWMHKAVDVICDDCKENTLTVLVTTATGAGVGARTANIASKTGFTMLERHVARETAKGALKGGCKAFIGNITCTESNIAGDGVSLLNKLKRVEKWFDETEAGARIDNEIEYIQKTSHRVIDRTFQL